LIRQQSFLIRASESSKGDFSLTVQDMDQAKHYKIMQQGGVLVLTGCEGQTFRDLGDLVDYYTRAGDSLSVFVFVASPCLHYPLPCLSLIVACVQFCQFSRTGHNVASFHEWVIIFLHISPRKKKESA
jgi:hypothetical protein